MDNGMQNMLDMYLFETNTLVEQLDEILLSAEKAGEFSTDDINEIFRIMHTIKGSSAMMQFSSLSTLAHHMENLFYFIRENGGHSEVSRNLFDLLFQASDFIKLQTGKLENDEPLSEDLGTLLPDLERLLSSLKGSEPQSGALNSASQDAAETVSADIIATDTSIEATADNLDSCSIRVFFEEDIGMENLRAFMLISALNDTGITFTYAPENVEGDSSTATQIIESGLVLHFSDREDLSSAMAVIKSALNIRTYELLDSVPEKEEPVFNATINEPPVYSQERTVKPLEDFDTNDALKQQQAQSNSPSPLTAGKQSLISVNLSKLDKLMAIVGEIVITESMVTSNPDLQGLKLDNFTKSARQLRKLTDELQDTVMSIRMVPVSGVFQKMNRIVRDMSQSLGKPARLITIGAETEVDKTIVDSIGDPIMHMVRNSMDHGLEASPTQRTDVGKVAEGTITLSAQHTGSEVIISIQDDGRGIDTQKVLAKAKENNLLVKPESEYSQRDILQLLLMPGFSTNDSVTEYSGRGVGLDVVKKNLEKVGGIISMSTEEGNGTCTTMKIPLTMAIVDGMEIAVGKSIFTVPIHNIRQSFKITADEIVYDAARGEMVRRGEEFYPILRIHRLFNIPEAAENVEDGIIIWVEASDKSYCLFVDELLGEQQVVVKPLPAYLNAFNIKDSGIAGCTILGDGNISIILDILYLYETSAVGYY